MQELLNIFKALSDETRLRIIKLLEHGELCVCDITAVLQSSQPKVSFHLSTLKEAGLIKDRREGKWIHYSLTESDMFGRFLMLSVFERMDAAIAKDDIHRLEEFLKTKQRSYGENLLRDTVCAKCT
jgi:ArsR family transcriptional regulator